MSESRVPALLVHPAEIIADELRERGWSLDDLASRMGPSNVGSLQWQIDRVALDFYMTLRTPSLRMGDEAASGLARALGPDAPFWTNLDEQWRTWAQANPELAKQQQDAVEE